MKFCTFSQWKFWWTIWKLRLVTVIIFVAIQNRRTLNWRGFRNKLSERFTMMSFRLCSCRYPSRSGHHIKALRQGNEKYYYICAREWRSFSHTATCTLWFGCGSSTVFLTNQTPVYCGCPIGTHGCDLVSRMRRDQSDNPVDVWLEPSVRRWSWRACQVWCFLAHDCWTLASLFVQTRDECRTTSTSPRLGTSAPVFVNCSHDYSSRFVYPTRHSSRTLQSTRTNATGTLRCLLVHVLESCDTSLSEPHDHTFVLA